MLKKTELGRFAHEDAMPTWLVSMLQQDGQFCSKGVLLLDSGLWNIP